MNTSDGPWLLEHEGIPGSETWRNMVQWEIRLWRVPSSAWAAHTSTARQKLNVLKMSLQQMVTLAPQNMAPHRTIPES